jgi:hypothetical protein
MGLHNTGVQEGEIESGDRDVAVSPCRFNDDGPFMLVVGALGFQVGDNESFFHGFAIFILLILIVVFIFVEIEVIIRMPFVYIEITVLLKDKLRYNGSDLFYVVVEHLSA